MLADGETNSLVYAHSVLETRNKLSTRTWISDYFLERNAFSVVFEDGFVTQFSSKNPCGGEMEMGACLPV